ncbi:MAG TPA: phage portal protein [Anaerolineales bacterium]|nr:phage portal protein [Anaerolineales bacterium]
MRATTAGWRAGVRAYKSAWMASGPDDTSEFGLVDARRMRYAVKWGYFEGTPYERINAWAEGLKADAGLYRAIRSIYNPAGRLGDFWSTYLLGGRLLIDGDGRAANGGALPIITDSDAVREAIAYLYHESNLQSAKDVMALRGAVFGDVALRVVDEVDKVYIECLNPANIADVDLDARGYVKAYRYVEVRTDPDDPDGLTKAVYSETAERGDGDSVVYRTYKDDQPYSWSEDQPEEWEEPYGFIPLVMVQHRNVGLKWGWSEAHKTVSKIREADDLASKLSDQIRKSVDAPWLLAGVPKPDEKPTMVGDRGKVARSTENTDKQVRQDVPIIYAPEGAQPHAMVAPLDISATVEHIREVLSDIERDHPELKLMVLRASGTTSGAALRTAQEPVEVVVNQRRTAYDDGLRRAMQMAMSIGGHRGIFKGFGLDSYRRGDLDFSIGERPVFGVSEQDKSETDLALANTAKAMMGIGYAPDAYLRDRGWSEERIQTLKNSGIYRQMTFAQYP